MSTDIENQAGETTVGYQVLARRYRSQSFDEVVGQESIATTLCNAIERNRTAHAYLFCGTRGVGKTSMARIFAKALNATDDLSQQDAVGNAILRGEDMDVIEIDAASNNGVADARELIANAGLMPARSRWKIYIIDEVHMLSTSAFNALLKTMEEPPEHVKFILCTTDPHKVLPTIQSRCQRFDFKPITTARIGGHLRSVLEKEGLGADDSVVLRVAQLANGSMRDGLSLLDRLIAAAEGDLDAQLLQRALGLVPDERIGDIVDAIAEGDAGQALRAGKALLDEGLSIEQGLDALSERFRVLLAACVCGADQEVLGIGSEDAAAAAERAQAFVAEDLVHLIALSDSIASRTRFSGAARAVFDAGLVRMALQSSFVDAANLLHSGGGAPATKKKRPSAKPAISVSPMATPSKKPSVAKVKTPPTPPVSTANAATLETKSPVKAQATSEPKASSSDTSPVPHPDGPWAAIRAAVSSKNEDAILETLEFESFESNQLSVRPKQEAGSAADWIRSHPGGLETLVQRALGRGIAVKILSSTKATQQVVGGIDEHILDLPIVQEAIELFDASVIETHAAVSENTSPQGPNGESGDESTKE